MGIARALCRLLRRELPLLALRERSRLTRPAERRLGLLLTPYTHLRDSECCVSHIVHVAATHSLEHEKGHH